MTQVARPDQEGGVPAHPDEGGSVAPQILVTGIPDWMSVRPPYNPESKVETWWSNLMTPFRWLALAFLWTTFRWWRAAAVATTVAMVYVMLGGGK